MKWLTWLSGKREQLVVAKPAMATMQVRDLSIEVIRKPIKNLHIRLLPPHGLVRVSSPQRLSQAQIETAILERWGWIKAGQMRLSQQHAMVANRFADGEVHHHLGHAYPLSIEFAHRGIGVQLVNQLLVLRCAADASLGKRQQLMELFWRQTLNALVPLLLAKWQPILGVQVREWGIKKMKTRWGTCNVRDHRVWLNLHLAKASEDCIEYVLVHELVHLIEPNHSPRFHAIVGQHIPNWRALDQTLKSISTYEVMA